jgi:hypothetical protein
MRRWKLSLVLLGIAQAAEKAKRPWLVKRLEKDDETNQIDLELDWGSEAESDQIAQLRTYVDALVGENKQIRRRMNKVMLQNEELKAKINESEIFLDGINEFQQRLDIMNDLIAENGMKAAMFDSMNESMEDLAEQSAKNKQLFDISRKAFDAFQAKSNLNNKERNQNINALTEKIHRRFLGVEEKIRAIQDNNNKPDKNVMEGISARTFKTPAQPKGRETYQPMEFTNVARVLWETPKTCLELAERGLTPEDSGRYLIKPGDVEPFFVTCNFNQDKTTVHFDSIGSKDFSIQNFKPCNGTDCSQIDFEYELTSAQISALKSEMRHCQQSMSFQCVKSSISDRIWWSGENQISNMDLNFIRILANRG